MTKNSLTAESLEALKKSDKIYLENYTVNFPYKIEDLEKEINKHLNSNSYNLISLPRGSVEDESILQEAKTQKVALLVYGDSLSATTHMQLILECKKQSIPYQIFHNASILTTVAETGLSLYKFGKTTSMPNWAEHTNKPTSFITYIKQNLSIDAHTLILTDIGLEIENAINQLKEASEKESLKLPEKIITISNAGTENQKIFYDTPENLSNKNIEMPFCIIIPTKLHFLEEETLEKIKMIIPHYTSYKKGIMTKFDLVFEEISKITKNAADKTEYGHSQSVWQWVLKLKPDADIALQIAALGHDIDRSFEDYRKMKARYATYDEYKKAHALLSAKITCDILIKHNFDKATIDKVKHLIENHEIGGEGDVETLTEADSMTFFNNLRHYRDTHTEKETIDKIKFMYKRLSAKAKKLVNQIKFKDQELSNLVEESISEL